MAGDGWVDEVAARRAQPRECAPFIGAREPRATDHASH
jgi:hypothetical protein